MDGTGHLFRWFASAIHSVAIPKVVSYRQDQIVTVDKLITHVGSCVPSGPFAIVAESFSGPIAIKLAQTLSSDLRGILLSTSFITPPAPRWLANLPLALFFGVPPPNFIIRRLLLEPSSSQEVASEVFATIRSVPRFILAERFRQALRTDARDALRRCPAPVVFLAATRDRLLGTRGLAAVREARPEAEVVMLAGPHLLLQARPREAADVVGRYIREWFAS